MYGSFESSLPTPIYFEIENDGTNLHFRHSWTGIEGTYRLLVTEPLATFITTANTIGFIVWNASVSNNFFSVYDWFRRIT